MRIREIEAAFQSLYPKERGCEWDNDGLLVCADREREVNTVITCLDVTFSVIDLAIREKAELIVSHHPLIFTPLKRINEDGVVSRKILRMLANGISLLSLHTRLDGGEEGLNDYFAKMIGVEKETETVLSQEEPFIGGVGILSNPLSPEEFARRISKSLSAPVRLFSADKKISRVGYCCGSGKDFIRPSFLLNCDAFVGGDLGYHSVQEVVEQGMTVIDCGHFGSEKNVVLLLDDVLRKMNQNLRIIPVFEELGGQLVDFS